MPLSPPPQPNNRNQELIIMVLTATTSDASETNTEAASASPVAKVHERRFNIVTDNSRDVLLTDFGKETLEDRYLLPGESYQDLFARVAAAYADDQDHAQRLYDYISKLWFMQIGRASCRERVCQYV